MTSTEQIPLNLKLSQQASFENFYYGENTLLIDALKQFVDKGDFIFGFYGDAFSGRSHLLNASCLYAETKQQQAALLSFSELINMPPEILDGFEHYDIVCIDDIHLIAGQQSWEEAVFNLLNKLKSANKRAVVSANKPFKACEFSLPDLLSRLLWGSIFKLQAINDQHLIDFMIFSAQWRGMKLDAIVAEFIAHRVSREPAQIITLLEKLDRQSLAQSRMLTIPFVKTVCKI